MKGRGLALRGLVVAVGFAAPAIRAAPPGPPSPAAADYERLAKELEAYLWRHVLEPRFPRCVDPKGGGFHANYARDWSPRPDPDRFIVYQTRLVWTAAEVARAHPARREEYLGYLRHGLRYLADFMWDKEHGGFFTSVSLEGRPLAGAKWSYGNAFALYALASAYRASGDPEALALARNTFEWMEKHLRAGEGYLGGVKRDGERLPYDPDSVRPAPDAMYAPSAWLSMNVHIHVLEAYSELLRAAPDPRVGERTRAVLALLRDRFLVEPGVLHLFLTEDGRPIPGPVSYGHDFETGFLFLEAENALGEADPRTGRAARRLVDHALAWGFDPGTGQVFSKGFPLEPAYDKSVQWWEPFEALNVLALMHERHGAETPIYWESFLKTWRFIRERLTDEEKGGIHLGLDEHGNLSLEKSAAWFASYHATRALLLTAGRLRRLAPAASPSNPGS
jgi:mannobiose 2-epimerase